MSLIRVQRLNNIRLNRLLISTLNYSTQNKVDKKPTFKFSVNDPNADLLEWVTKSNSSPSAPLLPWYSIQLNIKEKLDKKEYFDLFLYLDNLINTPDLSKNTLKLTMEHPGLQEMINHLVFPYIKQELTKFGINLIKLGHFPINWKLSTLTLRGLIAQKDTELIWKLFELTRVEINLNKLEINEEFYNFLLGYLSHSPSEKYFELVEFLRHHGLESKWYYKSLWQFYSKANNLEAYDLDHLQIEISESDVESLMKETLAYFKLNQKDLDKAPDGSMIVYITQVYLRFWNNVGGPYITSIINKCLDLPPSINDSLISLFNQNPSSKENIQEFENFLNFSKISNQQKLAILKPILNHIYETNIERDLPYLDFVEYLKGKEYSYPTYCLLTKLLIKLNKSKEFHLFTKLMQREYSKDLDRPQLMTIIKGYDKFSNYYQVDYYYNLMVKKFGQENIPHNIALIYMNSLRRTLSLDKLVNYYENTYLKYYSRDLQSSQILGFTCMRLGDLNKLDKILIDPLLKESNPSLTLLTPLLQYRFYLCINQQLLMDSLKTLEKMFNLGVLPNYKIIQLIKIHLKPVSIFQSKLAEWDKLYGSSLVFRGFRNSLK
jgi:hypothetical protein